MNSELYQSHDKSAPQKKLAGVCIKLAKRFDLPVWLVRVLVILLALKFTWACVVGYGLAWLCMSDDR
ncbi:hypothetical protein A7985_17970 [Pseudoalteromonas luteoviolacea]|uniref:Phage shock protein PspC N-terminal domain-containing protein n=1 Tax=Pseudoalteromonas luteoviolacea TaxID=43657 RepID=A0A1C0TN82_9GAMM|nr:PspC domain-containing protein [Pseudoalteromonas luteoviolacea]MBQ4812187.1 PspC domain-containing protein [Pseudoalteromonas luteoviolacea]OCQ20309.1 hypothetical protein A7985_17970 [Pseudoalteromonas luteoviolacea]